MQINIQTTNREVNPQLLADVFMTLYGAALHKLGEEYMAAQLRAIS